MRFGRANVYAKSGVTIPAGSAFILTGNSGSLAPDSWEVDLPGTAGIIVHGYADGADIVDSAVSAEQPMFVGEPELVSVNAPVSKFQYLSVDASGVYQPRVNYQAIVGVALQDLAAAGPCQILPFLAPQRTLARAVPTSNAPTSAAAVDTLIGEMVASLNLRLGTGVVIVSAVNVDVQAGDALQFSLYCTPAAGMATEIASFRSDVTVLGKQVVPIAGHVAPSEIPSLGVAASHSFEIRVKAVSGTARYIGLQRRMVIYEG